MAQRGFARAFRAIFGHSHPSNSSDQPDRTPSNDNRYDTDGAPQQEELPLNSSNKIPSTNVPPHDPATPTPQDRPTPAASASRNDAALSRQHISAVSSVKDDAPSSQYSLRPRRSQPAGLASEPHGAETSHVKAYTGAGDSLQEGHLSGEEGSRARTRPLAVGRRSDAAGLPARYAGAFMPAPSAGTNSAIACRPELVVIRDLDNASLETLQRLCRKLSVEGSGGKEKLKEHIRAKLAQPRVLNEESMFIDAEGKPHTPSKEAWLAARRRPEDVAELDDGSMHDGAGRRCVTTTTIDRAKGHGADEQRGEAIFGKSCGGTSVKSGGEVAKSGVGVVAKSSGFTSKYDGGAVQNSTGGVMAKSGAGIMAKSGAGIVAKSGAGIMAKSGDGITEKPRETFKRKSENFTTAKSGATITAKSGGTVAKPSGMPEEERNEGYYAFTSNRPNDNVAHSSTDPSRAGAGTSAPANGVKRDSLNTANGIPMVPLSGKTFRDRSRSPGFLAPLSKGPMKVKSGVGLLAQRGGNGDGGGGPAESVDARGGSRGGDVMGRLHHEFGDGSRKLSPAEFKACLKESSGKVVAQGDKGTAALLVSKGSPVALNSNVEGGQATGVNLVQDSAAQRFVVPSVKATSAQAGSRGSVPPRPRPHASGPDAVRGSEKDRQMPQKLTQSRTGVREGYAAKQDGADSLKERGFAETDNHVEQEIQQGGWQMQYKRQAFGANDLEMEADIASERDFSASPLTKIEQEKQTSVGHTLVAQHPRKDRGENGRQKFNFNLNMVDKAIGEGGDHGENPFRGVFAGAAGGPSTHNIIGFDSNSAKKVASPPSDVPHPKANSLSPINNDIPMTNAVEETPNKCESNAEDQHHNEKHEYATPREILRSFNHFGSKANDAKEDLQNTNGLEVKRVTNKGSPRIETRDSGAPSTLPRYLRGFSSMSRPSQAQRYSENFSRDLDHTEDARGLSSLRPRRPMSTASAGLFVNLRNSNLAPENKYIAERLQKRGSLKERSGRPPLSSSSLRILQELRKVREENRALTSNKRTMSPMPAPPSVVKRIKRSGEFNKNAVGRDPSSRRDHEMQDSGKDMMGGNEPEAPVQNEGSPLAYPLTPLRPLPRLKAIPTSTKKRKSIAFGSGRKRPKSTLSNAAISEMTSLIEKDKDRAMKAQCIEQVPSEQPTTNHSTLGDNTVGPARKQPTLFRAQSHSVSSPTLDETGTTSLLPENNVKEPSFTNQPYSPQQRKADLAASSLFEPSSNFGADKPNIASANQKLAPGDEGSRPQSSFELHGKYDGACSKSKENLSTFDATDASVEQPAESNSAIKPQKALPSARNVGSSGSVLPFGAKPAKGGEEIRGEKNTNGVAPSLLESGETTVANKFSNVRSNNESQGVPQLNVNQVTRKEGENSSKLEEPPHKDPSNGEKSGRVLNLEGTNFSKAPLDPSRKEQTAQAKNVSAYDIFKGRMCTFSSPDLGNTLSPAPVPTTDSAFASASPATPVFNFGTAKDTSKSDGLARENEEKAQKSDGKNAEKVTTEAHWTTTPSNEPSTGRPNSEPPPKSTAVTASFGTVSSGAAETLGFRFGAPQKSSDNILGESSSQGVTLNTSSAAMTTAQSKTTAAKEVTSGSLFLAPPSRPFAQLGDQPNVAPEQSAEKSVFPTATIVSDPQSSPSIPSKADKSEGAKAFNLFSQTNTPGAPTTDLESTRPSTIFGAPVTSGPTEKPAAASFTFGSTAEVEKPPSASTGAVVPEKSSPFGLAGSLKNAGTTSNGNPVESSSVAPGKNTPAFGQPTSQGFPQSSDVANSNPQPLFSQSASAPAFSFGTTVGQAGQAASSSLEAGRFSFSTPARKFEKDPYGPFGGVHFKSTFASKPSGSMFVFGANPSQPLSTSGSGMNELATNATTAAGSAFVFGATPSAPPHATMGGGMSQAGVGANQPSLFASSSQQTNNPFGASTPRFGSAQPFGSTNALAASAPFGSVRQTPSTNANPFVLSQPGIGGATSFGASQPGLWTTPAQVTQPPFGSTSGATLGPSFSGFGNTVNNQPSGSMDTTMGTPQAGLTQFGAPLSSSLPAFGTGNAAVGGGFNIGKKQQQHAVRRTRRILRARRTNR